MREGGEDAIAIGTRLGRYRIDELLGRGGMGVVYRAFDTALHRNVALKTLSVDGVEARARFLRETRAVAALKHPNIVVVYDVGEDRDCLFFAMELLSGHTLRDAMTGASLADRLRWLLDVAGALAAAHDEGLVHRDVKPDNVMVLANGTVRVLDFGIARRVSVPGIEDMAAMPTGTPTTLTEAGRLIGTPMYMAPEQLRGEAVDARADQFAWGVTAYEVLAGAPPWKAVGNALSLVGQILSATPASLAERCPDVPREVVDAITRAMEKDRNARHASMHELVSVIGPFASSAGGARPAAPSGAARDVVKVSSEDAFAPTIAQTTTGADGRSRARRRAWMIGGACVVAATTVGVFAIRGPMTPVAPTLAPSASAVASNAATTPAVPCTPEAQKLYGDGVATNRTRAIYRAMELWKKAVDADATCAPASLALAMTHVGSRPGAWDLDGARVEAAHARDHTDHLSAGQAALLEAFENMLDERNIVAWADAMRVASTRAPNDPDVAYFQGVSAYQARRDDEARTAMQRATALHPEYQGAYVYLSRLATDRSAAEAMLSRCIALMPQANWCHNSRVGLFEAGHDCEALEKVVRARIVAQPAEPAPYMQLAVALGACGAESVAIDEAVRQARSRTASAASTFEVAPLALLAGDFAGAEATLRVEHAGLGQSTDWGRRVLVVSRLAHILDDTGRRAEADAMVRKAIAIAAALTKRVATEQHIRWTADFYARAFQAGALTRVEFENAVGPSKAPSPELDLWVAVRASPARTIEDLRAALATPPIISDWRSEDDDETPGALEAALARAYARIGDWPRALEFARSAMTRCDQYWWAYEVPDTWLLYGEALERTGDIAGARKAYDGLVARFSVGKLRVVPVDDAKKRLARLPRK